MEFIKRNSDYAVRSLAYMAKFPKNKNFLVNSIAKNVQVSEVFLRKIFQRLTQNGIVTSRRGKKGGFSLSKNPSQITIRQIIESLQGKILVNRCISKENFCSWQNRCSLKKTMKRMQKEFIHSFDKTTLKDLIKT